MYEEKPTVDERIDFLRRVKKASDQALADVVEHPGSWSLPEWQMEIVRDQHRRRVQDKIEAAAKRLQECITRGQDREVQTDEMELERLENRIREKRLRERYEREKEEILKKINN